MNPLWRLFEQTGSIEAYLLYRGIDASEDEDKNESHN